MDRRYSVFVCERERSTSGLMAKFQVIKLCVLWEGEGSELTERDGRVGFSEAGILQTTSFFKLQTSHNLSWLP